LSLLSNMTMWPDGFVHLDTLLREEAKHRGDHEAELQIVLFRRSYMHTPIQEVGIRLKFACKALEDVRKQWSMEGSAAEPEVVMHRTKE
jgi:hypothetical protein